MRLVDPGRRRRARDTDLVHPKLVLGYEELHFAAGISDGGLIDRDVSLQIIRDEVELEEEEIPGLRLNRNRVSEPVSAHRRDRRSPDVGAHVHKGAFRQALTYSQRLKDGDRTPKEPHLAPSRLHEQGARDVSVRGAEQVAGALGIDGDEWSHLFGLLEERRDALRARLSHITES